MDLDRPLFSLVVQHAFFAGGVCRGLRFAPSDTTAALLARTGCVVRARGDGFAVYGEPAAPGRAEAQPAHGHWLVQVDDPVFANGTEHLPAPGAEVLFFDAAHAQPEAESGCARLHAGRTVSRDDVFPLQWPALAAALSARERRVPPCGVLRLPLRDDGARYLLRFAPRAPVWKYFLLGDWSGEQLQIIDLGREAEFAEPVPEQLGNGQPAWAIRSKAGIALGERSPRRFQLRARGNGGGQGGGNGSGNGSDKVLIKRLPVAGAQQFHRETIDGVPTLVCEIYVHR